MAIFFQNLKKQKSQLSKKLKENPNQDKHEKNYIKLCHKQIAENQ